QEKRARLIREVVASVRRGVGDAVVGMRISLPVSTDEGIHEDDFSAALGLLGADGELDYVSVVAGTAADAGGAMQIVPAMSFPVAYRGPRAGRVRNAPALPLLLTGRINEPQEAERILTLGQADLCGMTRALICDPEVAAKTARGELDDIRAC